MVPTNAHQCIEISLCTHLTPICFSQPYDHLERNKIQRYVFYIPEDGHMVGSNKNTLFLDVRLSSLELIMGVLGQLAASFIRVEE